MAKTITFSEELLSDLHAHNILTKFNSGPPENGAYGWIKVDSTAVFRTAITIEENAAFYGGTYKPFPGGRKSHGLSSLGSFSYTFSALPESMRVGRYCSISSGLKFLDSAHPLGTLTTSAAMFRPNNNIFRDAITPSIRTFAKDFQVSPNEYPVLGHDVWIGANVTLSPSIMIGTGAVIASGALVTKNVPPYAVVGGNPAKIIKYRFDTATIDQLLMSRWWEYDPQAVFDTDPENIPAILERIKSENLPIYTPRSVSLG